jgi:hypothetical protein
MSTDTLSPRAIRQRFLLAFAFAWVIAALAAPITTPAAEAGKPGGSTGSTGPAITVVRSGEALQVTVSGKGFTPGKKITVDAYGPSPAPLSFVTASSTGTFSYAYTLPSVVTATDQTWTFAASEEARNGWKLKAKTTYVVPVAVAVS